MTLPYEQLNEIEDLGFDRNDRVSTTQFATFRVEHEAGEGILQRNRSLFWPERRSPKQISTENQDGLKAGRRAACHARRIKSTPSMEVTMPPTEYPVQSPDDYPIDYDRYRYEAILLRRAARAAAVDECLGSMMALISTRFWKAPLTSCRFYKHGTAGK